MVKDLLCHRSGLGLEQEPDVLATTTLSRAEILHRYASSNRLTLFERLMPIQSDVMLWPRTAAKVSGLPWKILCGRRSRKESE
jgi:hypothetical protein